MRLQRALHWAMFTVKISRRNKTTRNLAEDLAKLGWSQSSRGTTAAFRGMLTQSATVGQADDVVAPSGRFGTKIRNRTRICQQLEDTEHKKLLIKCHGFVELPHAAALVAVKSLTEKCGSPNPRRAGPRHRRGWSDCRIRTSTLEEYQRRR